MMVLQIQLTKRQDVVPMTRDYIAQRRTPLRVCRKQVVARRYGSLANNFRSSVQRKSVPLPTAQSSM